MNPPVDAPASSASQPGDVDAERGQRVVELLAAAPDEPRRRSLDDDRFRGRDQPRHLDRDRATDEHPAGLDQGAGFDPALGQSTPHEFGVESPAGAHDRDVDGASCRWPRSPSWRRSSWPGSSWQRSSWRRSSWPRSSWPCVFLAAVFLAGVFLAAVFLAAVFLAGGLLGRGLLGRGLLGRAFLAAVFLAAVAAPLALAIRRSARASNRSSRRVELLAQPADLLGDFALDQRRQSLGRLATTVDERLDGRLRILALDLARLDELFDDCLCLLARRRGETSRRRRGAC